MVHLVRKVACLAAVLLPCAEGHLFGRLGRKSPPDPSSMSAMSMSAVDGQLALQKGSCHDAWVGGLSTQCPEGAVMALKGHSTMVGLAVSVSRCEPAGCLHSPYAQEGGGGHPLLDENGILKDAMDEEIAMLAEQHPGQTFDKHLAAMRKTYIKDGSHCKATLAELLREAPAGQPATTTTTIQFFVELADYRGIVGPEVDEARALLKHSHRQEMILAFARRAPQLLADRYAPEIAQVGRRAEQKAKIIDYQQGTIAGIRAKLSIVQQRYEDQTQAKVALAQTLTKVTDDLAVVKLDLEAAERTAVHDTELLRSELDAARAGRQTAVEQSTHLEKEISIVQKRYEDEIKAKNALTQTLKNVTDDLAVVQLDLKAAEKNALHDTELLRSALDDERAGRQTVVEQSTRLEKEISIVQQRYEDEAKAKDALTQTLKNVTDDLAVVHLNLEAAEKRAVHDIELLRSELDGARDGRQTAVEQSEAAALELSGVNKRLDEEVKAKQLAVTEVEVVNAIMAGVDTDLMEAFENNAKLVDELAESKIASANICDKLLQEKDADIADLEESCRVESANEGTRLGEPRECPLQREEAMRGWLACTDKTDGLMDDWEDAVVEVERLRVSMASLGQEGEWFREEAGKCSASLEKERLDHQQHLASLDSCDKACDCPEKEVPTVDGAGNASEPEAPTPQPA